MKEGLSCHDCGYILLKESEWAREGLLERAEMLMSLRLIYMKEVHINRRP